MNTVTDKPILKYTISKYIVTSPPSVNMGLSIRLNIFIQRKEEKKKNDNKNACLYAFRDK